MISPRTRTAFVTICAFSPIFAMLALACGSPPEPPNHATAAPSASASSAPVTPDPPDGPMPTLRTGSIPPMEHQEILAGHVDRSYTGDGYETLAIDVSFGEESLPREQWGSIDGARVGVSVAGTTLFAFAETARNQNQALTLWIRRPADAAGTPVSADLFLVSGYQGAAHHFHARADDPKQAKQSADLVAEWERALATRIAGPYNFRAGVWQTFASARLREMAPEKKAPPKKGARPVRPQPAPPRRSTDDLAVLMDTSTGALAVQEALQSDRPILLAAAREKRTIPIATVTLPPLEHHPWQTMTAKLGTKPPAEPLATTAPAEFYYVRAGSFDALLRLLDQVDTWGTPASHAVNGELTDSALAARYEAELGLVRGPLSRALGPQVVLELAVVGSDPYVKEGTDVTVIFRVKDHGLFNAGLASALAEHARTHGAMSQTKVSIAGVDVSVARSQDGTVRQHRATVGDLEIVSNSPAAIQRVLEVSQGKHARLSDEPDFQYMLARDPTTRADVLGYMGDRYVAEVIGPRQKIGEARRQIALGELLTPGFSSLLYGYMYGKSPATADDLLRARLLDKSELAHGDGGAIAWKPGETARSSWGTPAELVPLIDGPLVDTVSESERAGYQRFARGYQNDWASYIDPVALRLSIETKGDHASLTAEMRELPLIDGTDYRKIELQAGASRFEAAPIAEGARLVIGLGDQSELRQLLTESRGLFGHQDIKFDWIGSWTTVGVLDRSAAANAFVGLADDNEISQKPLDDRRRASDSDAIKLVSQVPFYAEVAVKNPLGAALALTGLRAMANEAAPGLVDWGEAGTYRGASIVRVSIDPKKAHDEFQADVDTRIYYSLTQGALIAALSEPVLRHLIDDRVDGRGPKAPAENTAKTDKNAGTQFAVEAASDPGHAVWSVLAWLLEGQLVQHGGGGSLSCAEALLYGAPDHASDAAAMRALAFAYFGSAPLAPDGGAYTLTPEGLKDPVRGTAFTPIWPAVPVPGSPVEAVMKALGHARAELSFDDEGQDAKGGKMRSLHARVTTQVAAP